MRLMTNSLQAVLNKRAKEIEVDEAIETPVEEASPKVVNKPKSRVGTVLIGGHFPKPVLKQLRFLAVEEDKSNQELLSEALDLLFIKKGKKKIGDIISA